MHEEDERWPGDCGECIEPDEFEWDPFEWINDAPIVVCKKHRVPAPGWIYCAPDLDIDMPTQEELDFRDAQERMAGPMRRAAVAGATYVPPMSLREVIEHERTTPVV